MATAEIKRHWSKVASLGCIISQKPNPTIHHCHGGSLKDIGIHVGMGQKQNDWLVIPLDHELHTGQFGIDNGMGELKGVREWERYFSTQVSLLNRVSLLLGYNVFEKAGFNIEELLNE